MWVLSIPLEEGVQILHSGFRPDLLQFLTPVHNPVALVLGVEEELGPVSFDEIKPFIMAMANESQLKEVAPAPGWKWEN